MKVKFILFLMYIFLSACTNSSISCDNESLWDEDGIDGDKIEVTPYCYIPAITHEYSSLSCDDNALNLLTKRVYKDKNNDPVIFTESLYTLKTLDVCNSCSCANTFCKCTHSDKYINLNINIYNSIEVNQGFSFYIVADSDKSYDIPTSVSTFVQGRFYTTCKFDAYDLASSSIIDYRTCVRQLSNYISNENASVNVSVTWVNVTSPTDTSFITKKFNDHYECTDQRCYKYSFDVNNLLMSLSDGWVTPDSAVYSIDSILPE